MAPLAATAGVRVERESGIHLKLALNAYSFDKPLRDGSMSLEDVVHYCARHGIDGLDATGYYFPGYPKVPSDDAIYSLKRTAHVNGVSIIGTGVRNLRPRMSSIPCSILAAALRLISPWRTIE